MTDIGIVGNDFDILVRMYGVGEDESSIERVFELLRIGEFTVTQFLVQRGPLDYGFQLDGIIGSDFLRALGLVIDYRRAEIRKDA